MLPFFFFFWWPNNILMFIYTINTWLSIRQLIDTWIVLAFGLLWIMSLRIFTYKCLCRYMFSILPGIYLGVELPNPMLTLSLIFKGPAKPFTKQLYQFRFTPSRYKNPIFLYTQPTLFIVGLFHGSYPSKHEWYLSAVLICISLMTNDIEDLFTHLLTFPISSLLSIQILCLHLNRVICLFFLIELF